MKVTYTTIFALLACSFLASARTSADNQGRSFEGDRAYLKEITQQSSGYLHSKTGIILPPKIAGLKLGRTHTYDDPGLGESVAYQSEYATATLYIYNYGRDAIKDDPGHRQITDELIKATSALKEIEKLGVYEDVQVSESGRKSGKEGIFTFISVPASYVQVKNPKTREPINPIETNSLIGVGIYKNHYIKLRYSIRPEANLEDSIKVRDEFVSALTSLVIEVDLRPTVMEHLETYFEDPFSARGRDALGGIAVYAEKSYLVILTINPKVTPWFSIDDYPYGSELLGAYIAGQVHAQLSSGIYASNEAAGREQVLKVYKKLKSKDSRAFVKELEDDLLSE
ncbi:MAG: hypothetical protein EA353_06020 [Puniceicoccaceae bacterium]|nr:MAG: hypothetical protein EA353_06020 [Puniceicoccaceae bacterium]